MKKYNLMLYFILLHKYLFYLNRHSITVLDFGQQVIYIYINESFHFSDRCEYSEELIHWAHNNMSFKRKTCTYIFS